MEYRILGRSGVKVSPLCLGADNFANPTPEDESIRMIERAMDAGINIIDTSNSYMQGESERIIGRALAKNGRRNEILIATKVHYPVGPGPNDRGNSRLHILKACEDSLRRLQTDHIDLYQTHRPDFDVPLEETLGAMTDLVQQGKVRYIGSSTAPAWKVMEGIMMSELKGFSRYVSEQPPYNLLDRRIENELVPLCRQHGLGIIPWSPLAMGMLAGRYPLDKPFPEGSRAAANPEGIYARRINRRGLEVSARVPEIAARYGLTPGQLSLLWVKDQPAVTAPIVGPRTLDQLDEMLAIAELRADDELRAEFDDLVPPGMAVSNFHNTSGWMVATVWEE